SDKVQGRPLNKEETNEVIRRPNYGIKGRETEVYANYFEVKKIAEKPSPKKPFPDTLRAVFQKLEEQERDGWFSGIGVVYDCTSTLYTTESLNLGSENKFATTLVILKEEGQDGEEQNNKFNETEYIVKVCKLQRVNLEDLEKNFAGNNMDWNYFDLAGIDGINALIHHIPSMKYVRIDESIFLPSTRRSLGGGAEIWMGWFESFRPGQVFYEPGNLVELIKKFLGLRPTEFLPSRLDQNRHQRINKFIKNLKFNLTYRNNRIMKIKGLSTFKSFEVKFDSEEFGKQIDVQKYYYLKYKKNLEYSYLVEIKGHDTIKVPIEGQRFKTSNLSGEQRKTMIKYTALCPRDNIKSLKEGINNVLEFKNDEKLKEFGTVVDTEMTIAPARVLSPPSVLYHPNSKAGKSFVADKGVWNLRNRKYIKSGTPLNYWIVIVFSRFSHNMLYSLKGLIKEFVRISRAQGMEIYQDNPRIEFCRDEVVSEIIEEEIKKQYRNANKMLKNDIQFMFIVLPDEDEKRYHAVKNTVDTILGIPSQCVQYDKIKKSSQQYFANVSSKVNIRLGGINQSIDGINVPFWKNDHVLLLGADVTHFTGQAGPTVMPSICAVVGSLDKQGGQYFPMIESQKVGQEKIENISGMVYRILSVYHEKNGALPDRIIMYRDGVSESQFKMVLEYELKKIKEACIKLSGSYKPKITFITIGKRHQTRLYPKEQIDTDSATRSVSIPPPTYYAHLAAKRASPDGYEKQFRLHCPRFNFLIVYKMTEKRKNDQYTYIVEESLTENQGASD
ncbi:6308_t:CDS:10, partial [Entrophospora sp. SA101]